MGNARYYFPLGVAEGEAFCNRQDERKLLLANINAVKHTLLMAPRRYGKSSLAHMALQESGLPHVDVDFYMARNERVIESYILSAVVSLIGKALGPVEKFMASIKQAVKFLKPRVNIESVGMTLELVGDNAHDPATNIKEALELLEKLLAEKNQQAVLLFDEFQIVGEIAMGHGVEAAIRHVAQKTKFLSFIFSGSSRHLLNTMFEDDSRPLYKLCFKMEVSRIGDAHYNKQINTAAQIEWSNDIDKASIDKILLLTEKHPYYVNRLCDLLWAINENIPTIEDINVGWNKVLAEEKSEAVKELARLSAGQKQILLQLAKDPHIKLTSKASVIANEMSVSTISTAIKALDAKDIIEAVEGGYRIINPVIRYYVLAAG